MQDAGGDAVLAVPQIAVPVVDLGVAEHLAVAGGAEEGLVLRGGAAGAGAVAVLAGGGVLAHGAVIQGALRRAAAAVAAGVAAGGTAIGLAGVGRAGVLQDVVLRVHEAAVGVDDAAGAGVRAGVGLLVPAAGGEAAQVQRQAQEQDQELFQAASSFAKVVWEAGDRPETERLPACDTQMVVWPEAPALSVAK